MYWSSTDCSKMCVIYVCVTTLTVVLAAEHCTQQLPFTRHFTTSSFRAAQGSSIVKYFSVVYTHNGERRYYSGFGIVRVYTISENAHFLLLFSHYESDPQGKGEESETNCSGLQVALPFLDLITNNDKTTYTGRDCLPVAMVLITSWRRCIQAVKMKMAPDVIHTLILLWKSAQMLTWLRR